MEHPNRSCLVEIVVTDPAGDQSRGSGYRVAPGWVLTAHHVIKPAGSISVWFGAPAKLRAEDGVRVDPGSVRAIPALDLALLPVPEATAPAGFVPPLFGQLDRNTSTAVPAEAQGFPWFKLRPAPGRDGVWLREVHVATALVSGGAHLKTGTLAFPVLNGAPPSATPTPTDRRGRACPGPRCSPANTSWV